MRKTVNIKDLIDTVNNRNKGSTCSPDVRQGWNSLLEKFLHECDVYAGFGYLGQNQVPEGHSPGVILDLENPSNNQFPDETRRFCYYHNSLA